VQVADIYRVSHSFGCRIVPVLKPSKPGAIRKPLKPVAGLLGSALLLAACSGGGGGSGSSPAVLAAALPDGDHIVFTTTAVSLSEASRHVTLTVARTGSGSGVSKVRYSVEAGSATSGLDMRDVAGELSWKSGELTTRAIDIEVFSDLELENEESFRVVLEAIEGEDSVRINSAVDITLTDSPCGESLSGFIEQSFVASAPCYQIPFDLTVNGSASLTLAPGTTLIADAGVAIRIQGNAEFNAVGTDRLPVRIQGASRTSGYWQGIKIASSNPAQHFDHVNVSDSVTGIDISDDGRISGLKNTRIDNTSEAAIRLPIQLATFIEESNRFSRSPGGIKLLSKRVTPDMPVVLPGLDTYFQLTQTLIVDGALTLDAGVDLRMAEETQIYVSVRGSFNAVGTVSEPIRMAGVVETPGFWQGLWFSNSSSPDNRLEHVTVAHGGGDPTRDGNISISGADTRLSIVSSRIEQSAGYGLWLDSSLPLVTLDSRTTFAGNARGDRRR